MIADKYGRSVRRFWESPWPFAVLMIFGLAALEFVAEFFTLDLDGGF